MNGLTSPSRTTAPEDVYVDPEKFAATVRDLIHKVGRVRDQERQQLAHRIGVSATALGKFQALERQVNPRIPASTYCPPFEFLQRLIDYYYPTDSRGRGRRMIGLDGSLAPYSERPQDQPYLAPDEKEEGISSVSWL